MAFLNSLSISGSALTATRLRMDIISENISNIETTRTPEGGPYRRKMVVYEPIENQRFRAMFQNKLDKNATRGVKVTDIVEDERPFTPVYNPTHPDAGDDGYVLMPNVDPLKESIDMMAATRAYEANITALNSIKGMAMKALEIR